MENVKIKTERNMGIELFRVVSMLMVVTLHVLGRGGFTSKVGDGNPAYYFIWWLETISYCAVNCYALISGYVGLDSSVKFRRIVFLWLEVFTLGSFCGLFTQFIFGEAVSTSEWQYVLFPLLNKDLWYLDAYFILFFFMPILNKGLKALDRKTHFVLATVPTIAIIVAGYIGSKDVFLAASGFSPLWLAQLYVVGAYFKLYGFGKLSKGKVALPIFFGLGTLAFGVKLLLQKLVEAGVLSKESYFGSEPDFLVSYISPVMVIMAIALLGFFSEVKIKARVTKIVIQNLAKASFGVFAVHVNSVFWYHFMGDKFAWATGYDWYLMIPLVIGIIIVFYLECSAYSLIRIYAFKYLGIDKAVCFLADKVRGVIDRRFKPYDMK